ncbi:RNA polymerase sigma factor [Nocardioides marmoriginsengisoli]|uniref:RNA polymerase sigma factor n=1 Tax=Nocardioides marmoriginsengisoli TaxID=661483 RepID=UPI00160DD12C|nr:sigma-70 family RNA polymerase sigma factor [Nocardioides marmoriginsengisoli]
MLVRHESLETYDDGRLLALARAGDPDAAAVLWVRSWPSALAVARFVAADTGDAEDLASEAMATVFAAIARGAGPTDVVRAYVATTIRNLHTTALRRQRRTGTPVELDDDRVLRLVAETPDVTESALVGRAFRGLPDRWRQVLWATLVEGRPGDQVATELGIAPSAVYALKARALEALRQRYLTEHALPGCDPECAEVHRSLAATVRGRNRRTADDRQVWQHLRGCAHCAEGYRELSAINTRLGALLGPAAIGLVLAGSESARMGVLESVRLASAGFRYGVAAAVAGAVAATVLAVDVGERQPEPDGTVRTSRVQVAPTPTVLRKARVKASAPHRVKAASQVTPAVVAPTCAAGADLLPSVVPTALAGISLATVPELVAPAVGSVTGAGCPSVSLRQDPLPGRTAVVPVELPETRLTRELDVLDAPVLDRVPLPDVAVTLPPLPVP